MSFVRVSINNEDLGRYSFVEHIKGKFVRCHFELIAARVDAQLADISGIDVCPESNDDPCIVGTCGDAFEACDTDEACSCWSLCIDGDTEAECQAACGQASAPAAYDALTACIASECADACDSHAR